MNPKKFFTSPQNTTQRQYEALRSFFVDGGTAQETAEYFGYTLSSFYSLIRDFRKKLEKNSLGHFFFVAQTSGRKPKDISGEINTMILNLRKKYLSVPDIKAVMDVQGYQVSERYVYNLLNKDGFARLPRRDTETLKKAVSSFKLEAPKSIPLDYTPRPLRLKTPWAFYLFFLTCKLMVSIPLLRNRITQKPKPSTSYRQFYLLLP